MAEYIERGEIFEAYEKVQRGIGPWRFENLINSVPAADVAPVVHSRFVNMGGFPACENCGASPGVREPKPDNPSGFPPYCYACGARMDKEAPDGD